jgi:indole-3-glycerol phosphate synthase
MSILNEIVAAKRKELSESKSLVNVRMFEASIAENKSENSSLSQSILKKPCGIIAEFKRRSPSKPEINTLAKVGDIVGEYEKNGAAGVSILTNSKYFGGQKEDIIEARKLVELPILRKEFIIDKYQILEAKSLGANAILLIASILSKEEIKSFTEYAHSLELEVLLELHSVQEVDKIEPSVNIIGINNRDLSTFKTSYKHSIQIYPELPKDKVLISESGINQAHQMKELLDCGFNGFLIGEYFMKTKRPGDTLDGLIKQLDR